MYDIRFYYKNTDKNCKKDIVYHLYNSYETYEEACKEMKYLMQFYKEIGVDEVVFTYNFPEDKIEAYAAFLSERGKDFTVIVKSK